MRQTVDALLKLVALYRQLSEQRDANPDDFLSETLQRAIEILLDAIAE